MSKNPPYFAAVEPRKWTSNRFYRVYVLPEELVGVWAGSGNELSVALTGQFGLVGGLLRAAMSPAKKNLNRREELDSKPFEDVRHDHEHNFFLALDDIDDAEIVPPSMGFFVNYGAVRPIGLLRLRMVTRELLTLALTTRDDLDKARTLLPPLLGDRLRMEVIGERPRTPPIVWLAAFLGIVLLLGLLVWGAGFLAPKNRPGPDGGRAVPNIIPAPPPPNRVPPNIIPAPPLPNRVPPNIIKVPPGVIIRTPKNWEEFTSAEFGFKASLPRLPDHAQRQSGNTPRTIHNFTVNNPEARYSITTLDPPLPGRPTHLFQTLRALRGDFPFGQIDPEKPLLLGCYRGFEFGIHFVDREIVRRTYHGHGRTYTLEFSSARFPDVAADARAFFDSFKPLDADQAEPFAPPMADVSPPTKILEAPSEIVSLAFGRDGQNVRVACQNGEIYAWDIETGRKISAFSNPDKRMRILAWAQSSDEVTAVASALSGRCNLLDTARYKLKAMLIDRLSADFVWSVAFSPDGQLVATGHRNQARLWSVADSMLRHTMNTVDQANTLNFFPDGKTLAVGTRDSTVTLWATDTGAQKAILKGKPGETPSAGAIWALACSPDGTTLAAGGNDQTVRLWNLETRAELHLLKHGETVRTLAFSPDAKSLAAGDDAGNITLWDPIQGAQLALLPAPGNRNAVRALAFSKNGVLAAGFGNDVRIWQFDLVSPTRKRGK